MDKRGASEQQSLVMCVCLVGCGILREHRETVLSVYLFSSSDRALQINFFQHILANNDWCPINQSP